MNCHKYPALEIPGLANSSATEFSFLKITENKPVQYMELPGALNHSSAQEVISQIAPKKLPAQ